MRRKSGRTKKTKSPESKAEEIDKQKKVRTSRRRKRSSSSAEVESADEGSRSRKNSEAEKVVPNVALPDNPPENSEKSETIVDGEVQDQVWQVKSADNSADSGEIQKLKICLTRPPSTPERPDKSPSKSRRKLNRNMSHSDTSGTEGEDKRRTRHRSRRSRYESRDLDQSNIDSSVTPDESNQDSKVIDPEPDIPIINKVCDDSTKENTCKVKPEPVDEKSTNDCDTSDKSCIENQIGISNQNIDIAAADNKNENLPIQSIDTSVDVIEKEDIKIDTEYIKIDTEDIKIDTAKDGGNIDSESRTSLKDDDTPNLSKESAIKSDPDTPTSSVNKSSLVAHVEESDVVQSNESLVVLCEESLAGKNEGSIIEKGDSSNVEEDQSPLILKDGANEADDNSENMMNADDKDNSENVMEAEQCSINEENPNLNLKTDEKAPSNDKDGVTTQSFQNTELTDEKENHSDVVVEEKNLSTDEVVPLSCIINQELKNKNISELEAPCKSSMRKRRWGTRTSKTSKPTIVNISTDSLKDIISDVKPAELDEVIAEKPEKKPRDQVREKKDKLAFPKMVIDNRPSLPNKREQSPTDHTENERSKTGLSHRKILIVNDEQPIPNRPPTPSKHRSSNILFITNLVRPFTLPLLKNLLQRTGKIVENGFWIDRIKSKCYVKYEKEDEAVETRHALHGVTWPVSNPKTLNVDFASQEDFDEAQTKEDTGNQVAVPGTVEAWIREQDAKKEEMERQVDSGRSWEKKNIVREWDVGKNEKDKERFKEKVERRRHHSPEKIEEVAKKYKKKEEEAPAKLLDDLFKKTKVTPSIYWLPLTAETIAIKEEQRRVHVAEHERHLAELRRAPRPAPRAR